MKKLLPTFLALTTGLLFVGLAPAAHATERASSLAPAVHGKGKPSAGKPKPSGGKAGKGKPGKGKPGKGKPGGWKGWTKKHYSHRHHRWVYWSPADGYWYYGTANDGYVAIDDMTDENCDD